MLGLLVYDRDLRQRVLEGQRRRLQDFGAAVVEARLTDALAALQIG